MNLGKLANLLTDAARIFWHKHLFTDVLPGITGKKITPDTVKELIKPYLANIELPADLRNLLNQKLNKYSEEALESIKRNNHMSDYVDGDTLDKISAEALLVDFTNYACAPLDLALYTSDLKEPIPA